MIIAIDGPAGSGKSSTAKAVAGALGFTHLDTGAMYRAVTLRCLKEGIPVENGDALEKCVQSIAIEFEGSPPNVRVLLDGHDVTTEIRGSNVTTRVSDYCRPAVVRNALVARQRELGAQGDVVCEGRDIGTVVFPGAELKVFMVASVEERARRRQKDFAALGITKTLEELAAEIETRDAKDSGRELSPLKKADDARLLDTTKMDFDQQVAQIVAWARELQQN